MLRVIEVKIKSKWLSLQLISMHEILLKHTYLAFAVMSFFIFPLLSIYAQKEKNQEE